MMATKKKTRAKAKLDVVATAVAHDGTVDPTLLTSKVAIRGKEYTLCLDLWSIARADHELRSRGTDVNLLSLMPALTLEGVLVMFALAVQRFHPEITFEEALKIPTMPYVYAVQLAIAEAWQRGMAEPEEGKKNPTQPGN